jgi:hypothetical protein
MLNPDTNQPAALSYLQDLGVDPARQVLIAALSHFHADHYHGFHDLIRKCDSALVALPQALYPRDILASFKMKNPAISNGRKFARQRDIFEAAEGRRRLARAGTSLLLKEPWRQLADGLGLAPGERPKIVSLSPSDATCDRIHKQLGILLDRNQGGRLPPDLSELCRRASYPGSYKQTNTHGECSPRTRN